MYEQRKNFPEFRIPLVCIPAVISNNVPGTDISIGSDTALNEIVSICDKLKLSAMGSKRRVFLVETMGGYCGYLASMSALASGADHSFIFEEPFTVNDIVAEVDHLKKKMQGDLKRGILISNEMANKNYTAEFIEKVMLEEGKGVFSTRTNILGHMQQGGCPSAFDRNLGIKMGARSLKFVVDLLEEAVDGTEFNDASSAVVVGIIKNKMEFSTIEYLKENDTNFDHRIPLSQWWMKIRPLSRILAKHEALYRTEVNLDTLSDTESNGEEEDEPF